MVNNIYRNTSFNVKNKYYDQFKTHNDYISKADDNQDSKSKKSLLISNFNDLIKTRILGKNANK